MSIVDKLPERWRSTFLRNAQHTLLTNIDPVEFEISIIQAWMDEEIRSENLAGIKTAFSLLCDAHKRRNPDVVVAMEIAKGLLPDGEATLQ